MMFGKLAFFCYVVLGKYCMFDFIRNKVVHQYLFMYLLKHCFNNFLIRKSFIAKHNNILCRLCIWCLLWQLIVLVYYTIFLHYIPEENTFYYSLISLIFSSVMQKCNFYASKISFIETVFYNYDRNVFFYDVFKS